jgi:hypothetical protein
MINFTEVHLEHIETQKCLNHFKHFIKYITILHCRQGTLTCYECHTQREPSSKLILKQALQSQRKVVYTALMLKLPHHSFKTNTELRVFLLSGCFIMNYSYYT